MQHNIRDFCTLNDFFHFRNYIIRDRHYNYRFERSDNLDIYFLLVIVNNVVIRQIAVSETLANHLYEQMKVYKYGNKYKKAK